MKRVFARLALIGLIACSIRIGGVIDFAPILKLIYQIGSVGLIGAWLFFVWRRGDGFPGTPLDAPLFALALIALLAALFSSDPRVSLERAWPIVAHIFLFYICVDLMRSGYEKWLFEALFVGAGVVILIAALEVLIWYFGFSANEYYQTGWFEIGGISLPPTFPEIYLPFGHNNFTGMYAAVLLPLLFGWAMTVVAPDLKVGLALLAAGMFLVLILTQSRGAYLAFASLLAFSGLVIILHRDIRQRAPAMLRPILRPRIVIMGALIGAAVAFLVLYRLIILPDQPNPNDICRLDLWLSAIKMFQGRPLLGVGPGLYHGLHFEYVHWPHSPMYVAFFHPHNLLLAILAEGGVLALTAMVWVVVRFLRTWWAGWQAAPPAVRRRLEAVLVSLFAFSVHNMVDSFYQTPQLVPIIIMAAYVVVKADPAAMPVPLPALKIRRIALLGAATTLVAIQAFFIPVHRGALAQSQAMKALGDGDLRTALAEVRRAISADPKLALYRMEEANILGLLAEEDEAYLDAAIQFHERILEDVPAWDLGWHNLATLYAQAGDLDMAVRAEQQATPWNSASFNYRFKVGEYLLAQGRTDEAIVAFHDALGARPVLASSKYWTDPVYPDRLRILRKLIAETDDLEKRFDLAVYGGDLDTAARIAVDLPPDAVSGSLEHSIDALWPEGIEGPVCVACFYVRNDKDFLPLEVRLLRMGNLTETERDALERQIREVIFADGRNSGWEWYQLARVRGDSLDFSHYLAQGVRAPVDYREKDYPQTYGVNGVFVELAQARMPLVSPVQYEPWVILGEYFAEDGDWEKARHIFEEILKLDPYDHELQKRAADLAQLALGERAFPGES